MAAASLAPFAVCGVAARLPGACCLLLHTPIAQACLQPAAAHAVVFDQSPDFAGTRMGALGSSSPAGFPSSRACIPLQRSPFCSKDFYAADQSRCVAAASKRAGQRSVVYRKLPHIVAVEHVVFDAADAERDALAAAALAHHQQPAPGVGDNMVLELKAVATCMPSSVHCLSPCR